VAEWLERSRLKADKGSSEQRNESGEEEKCHPTLVTLLPVQLQALTSSQAHWLRDNLKSLVYDNLIVLCIWQCLMSSS